MKLEDVQARVQEAFHSFISGWLPTGGQDVTNTNGAHMGTLSNKSMEPGVHWMLNCGLGDESLEAKDVDNLIAWWTKQGNGRTASPPAKSDSTGKVEVHLFGVKHQNQSDGSLIKYKFNYHVPISGQVGIQLKGNQVRDLRSGRRNLAGMGLSYKPKSSGQSSNT